jgi:hypothetical protein
VARITIVEIAPEEQAHILTEVRRARYRYVLALHILLLCAAQRSPTEIAAVLFCSRSTVYRVVKAYRAGQLRGNYSRNFGYFSRGSHQGTEDLLGCPTR